jgi:1-aminocyclopropane-1-carboxylate deaminase
VGTGTTLAGLRNAIPAHQSVMGFVPMKQCTEQQAHIIPFLKQDRNTNWQLFPETHFGGFGKIKDELIVFMNDFYADNHIPLDIVYTAKMMYNIQQLLNDNYFNSSDKLLCIHTGGLQGNVTVQDKLIF